MSKLVFSRPKWCLLCLYRSQRLLRIDFTSNSTFKRSEISLCRWSHRFDTIGWLRSDKRWTCRKWTFYANATTATVRQRLDRIGIRKCFSTFCWRCPRCFFLFSQSQGKANIVINYRAVSMEMEDLHTCAACVRACAYFVTCHLEWKELRVCI